MSHTKQCRDRLETRLRADEDPRVMRADERTNKEITRRLEEQEGREAITPRRSREVWVVLTPPPPRSRC